MDRSPLTSDEVAECGQALYDQRILKLVEIEQNIGKVVVIDIETGEYGVDETGRQSERKLHTKHPGAAL